MSKFNVGDIVRLPSERPFTWSSNGQMDCFLNNEVVILEIHECGRSFTFANYGGWDFRLEDVTLVEKANSKKKDSAFDVQIGGGHYKDFKIQPTQFCLANDIPFAEGCVIKYISRHKQKNSKQDLEKAKHYIEMLIEHHYGES